MVCIRTRKAGLRFLNIGYRKAKKQDTNLTMSHGNHSSQRTQRNTAPTTREDWARSEAYHNGYLIPYDEALNRAKERSKEEGLPSYSVSPPHGKLLNLLAQSIGAKRILEVGTLGGCAEIGDHVICGH